MRRDNTFKERIRRATVDRPDIRAGIRDVYEQYEQDLELGYSESEASEEAGRALDELLEQRETADEDT